MHWSRPIAGTIKTVTVAREADGWYVCCSCAAVPTTPLALTGRETGLAVGLKVFLVTADGAIVENPRHSRTATRAVKKAQQRVSRRKQDSTRRKKAVRWLAKQHQTVRRQRQDFHHKTALRLVRQYDTIQYEAIQYEAIQPANLSARPTPLPDGTGGYLHNGAQAKAGLTSSLHDAGWGHFLTILACKAACAGKRAEAVPPAYTSQDCSGCGKRVPKSLSVRTHVCPTCGLILDRDEHATSTRRRTSTGAGSAFGESWHWLGQ